MIWFYVCLTIAVSGFLGFAFGKFVQRERAKVYGTLNVVHWSGRGDDLLLQLDHDTSDLSDGQYITLYVKCTRR